MKKLLSDYNDEKVDELIREALKKEVNCTPCQGHFELV